MGFFYLKKKMSNGYFKVARLLEKYIFNKLSLANGKLINIYLMNIYQMVD